MIKPYREWSLNFPKLNSGTIKMPTAPSLLTRRKFLKLSGSALALTVSPSLPLPIEDLAARRESRWGRVTTWRAWIHSEPHPDAPRVDQRSYDAIVNILDDVSGVGHYDHNPIWFRVIGGYVYSSWVQPVEYHLNRPVEQVDPPGALAWVTVPYTDVRARPDPTLARNYRLYFDAIFRVVDVQTDASGKIWYGLRDGLTWSGVNWVRGEHLRIIPPEELAPLSPGVDGKRVLIELGKQLLTCFEGKEAVFETRLSSGLPGMVTPLGVHRVLQKAHTRRMIGGEGNNYYDLPGIGFVTYFTEKGVAIHGTYWHNDYGRRRSHGCVNTPTAAAQWIFRWCRPDAPYDVQRIVAKTEDATAIEVVY
jgi:hypothetical protein